MREENRVGQSHHRNGFRHMQRLHDEEARRAPRIFNPPFRGGDGGGLVALGRWSGYLECGRPRPLILMAHCDMASKIVCHAGAKTDR